MPSPLWHRVTAEARLPKHSVRIHGPFVLNLRFLPTFLRLSPAPAETLPEALSPSPWPPSNVHPHSPAPRRRPSHAARPQPARPRIHAADFAHACPQSP